MKIAIFTITQNDPWLPLWVNHVLSQGFAREDVYVLNHESTGDFQRDLEADISRTVSVLQVRHQKSYDYLWLTETVSKFQRFLIGQYDVVVFAAADELLYPLERATVVDALQASREPWEYVESWDVIQQPEEGPLVLTVPWLAQRRLGCTSRRGRRLQITRDVTVWVPPSAGASPFTAAFNVVPEAPVSSAIVAAHMHRADNWLATQRHREISQRTLFPYRDDQYNPYKHNLITSIDAVIPWLLTDPDDPSRPATLRSLPMLSKEVADGRPGDVSSGASGESSVSAASLAGGA